MADPVWPVTNNMPQDLLIDGCADAYQESEIAFAPDKGPEILRSRFSAISQYFTGRLVLTPAQFTDLRTFYFTTCKRTARFDWKDPFTQQTAKCRIRKFSWVPHGTAAGGPFEVNLTLEVLP